MKKRRRKGKVSHGAFEACEDPLAFETSTNPRCDLLEDCWVPLRIQQ